MEPQLDTSEVLDNYKKILRAIRDLQTLFASEPCAKALADTWLVKYGRSANQVRKFQEVLARAK